MKNLISFHHFSRLLTAAIITTTWVGLTAPLEAQESKASVARRLFASPDEATKGLLEAARTADKPAMKQIFGPDVQDLLTGDEVQDKANFQAFSQALSEACVPTPEGNNTVILNIGTNKWAFPIPLVKTNGQWFFDTDAGREEIINRHIGGDELHAIGVCRAYVVAQKDYFSKDRDGSGVLKYALKLKSKPGKEDGLYWDPAMGPSPMGVLVAAAHAEGYGPYPKGDGPHAFHGYLFKILTSQGQAAPGGKANYMVHGSLTGGFALVAYPAEWGKSGIMTLIVNQDGKVYQRDLGEKTDKIAAKMTQYDPSEKWTLAAEAGFSQP